MMMKSAMHGIPAFFTNFFRRKKEEQAPAERRTLPPPELRITGRLLEYYIKPIVNELHRRTPKGLKYLKESCSK
ncbi:MAG TPA: hypothetical protein VF790_01320 [Dissulfurispiraceae bacterium]